MHYMNTLVYFKKNKKKRSNHRLQQMYQYYKKNLVIEREGNKIGHGKEVQIGEKKLCIRLKSLLTHCWRCQLEFQMIHQPKLSLLRLVSRRKLLLCTKSFNKASSSTFHSYIQILCPRESIQANKYLLALDSAAHQIDSPHQRVRHLTINCFQRNFSSSHINGSFIFSRTMPPLVRVLTHRQLAIRI